MLVRCRSLRRDADARVVCPVKLCKENMFHLQTRAFGVSENIYNVRCCHLVLSAVCVAAHLLRLG